MPGILTPDEVDEVVDLLLAPHRYEAVHVRARRAAQRAVTRAVHGVRHPLGFVCLPLHRDSRIGVCLHIWIPGQPLVAPTASAIHAHSWDMVSYVVGGRIRNDHITVTEPTATPSNRLLAIHSRDGADEIRPTDRLVRYTVRATEDVPAGSAYHLEAGQFHRSSTAVPTVTLVLGRSRRDATEYALGPVASRAHRVSRQRCTPDDVQSRHRHPRHERMR